MKTDTQILWKLLKELGSKKDVVVGMISNDIQSRCLTLERYNQDYKTIDVFETRYCGKYILAKNGKTYRIFNVKHDTYESVDEIIIS